MPTCAKMAFAALLLLGSAIAAAAQDAETCRTGKGDWIGACSRVVTSSRSTRDEVGNAYINRGQHYYEIRDYENALKDFNRAIPLRPKWLQLAYGNRGNVYYQTGEDEKAIDSYDKAIEIDPQYAAAYTARGLLYEKIGLIERARRLRGGARGEIGFRRSEMGARDGPRPPGRPQGQVMKKTTRGLTIVIGPACASALIDA